MRYWLSLGIVPGIIFCASCRTESVRGVQISSKLSSFVPPSTTALGGIDVDRIKSSEFYKRHANELNLPLLNGASERMGLDPRRDISEALITWEANQPVIMARGTFSARDIQPKILSLGATKSRYKDQSLFGDRDQAVFFPEQNVLLAGPVSALHSLIDAGRGGIPAAVQNSLEGMPKTDQIWAVSTSGFPIDRIPMRSDLTSAFSNLIRFVGAANMGIGVDAGVHFQANLTCFSADGARQVHDALRGGIGFARLMTKDNDPDTLRLYDAIQVDQDQKIVHVHADLAADLSDKLFKFLPGIESRAGQLLNR